MSEHRTQQRKLVGLLVKLKHSGVDEFAQKYATNLSEGGMFIRTREPKPRGTELNFKVEIANGQRVLQGIAIVRWTRGENDPAGPPGMGLEFLKLDDASRALVDKMVGTPAAAAATAPPAIAPAVAPHIAPAVAPVAPPALAIEIEIESAQTPSSNEIELELGALVAETPAPPEESPFDVDIDLELDAPAQLPEIAARAPTPPPEPATPVVLQAEVPAPPPVGFAGAGARAREAHRRPGVPERHQTV